VRLVVDLAVGVLDGKLRTSWPVAGMPIPA
jgi:hypothetical protein